MMAERQIRSSEAGLSIVEMLIVMVIISVIGGIAVMQFRAPDAQLKRQNVARELKVALERAKFDSVKRRAQSDLTPESAYSARDDNRARVIITATSYTLATDNDRNGYIANTDGTIEAGDAAVADFSGQNIVIAGSGIALPVTVFFDQRGEATAVSSSGTSPVFYICNVNCDAPSNSNANLLLVTPTGTVNLLGGGASPPSFAAANVTTVPTSTGLSNTVALP
jgi:Tfp pilus assembly protein FimT